MNAHSWTEALGWTLLHSLWQGALLAGLYLPARHWLRGHSPQSRYLLAVLTLVAMLIISGITLSRLWPQETDIQLVAMTQAVLLTGPGELPAEAPLSLKGLLTTLTPWLSWGWMLGVGLLALKWAGGFYYSRRLRVHGTQLPDTALAEQVLRWQQRLGIRRRVQLRLSSRIGSPMTLGHLRPVILIPLSLASGLSPEQWEAILLHELAHIRRADYLVNLIHSLVEILFFYHPLCWYLSRQIHREREACCDDLAVESCGDALRYAESLIRLQHLRFTPQTSFAMNLIPSQGAFSQRIQRLFVPTQDRKRSPWAILLALLCVTCLLSQSWKAQAQSTSQIATQGVEPFSVTITRDFTLKQLDELKARFAEKGIRLETSIAGVDAEGHLTAISGSISLPGGNSGTFGVDLSKAELTLSSSEQGFLSVNVLNLDELLPGSPLYLLDGRHITQKEADALDTETIATIDVLKGEAATTVYGPKAAEGVINIRLKTSTEMKEGASSGADSPRITLDWPSQEVIYILNGKRVADTEVKALSPEQIYSVNVLSAENALAKGLPAPHGAIVVITHTAIETKQPSDSALLQENRHAVKVIQPSAAAMYIIDGRVATQAEIENLDKDQVESLTIVQAASPGEGKRIEQDTVKILTKNAVAGEKAEMVGVTLFPNPGSQVFTVQISLKERSPVKVRVLDGQGRVLKVLTDKEYAKGQYAFEWNAGNQAPGTCYIQVQTRFGTSNHPVEVKP